MIAEPINNQTAVRFPDDDSRWAAVVHRDRSADGVFYYAVRSTGIYCRPSCASRLARRENVSFYSAPREAEQAGFRPCKRCRPNELAFSSPHAAAVTKACQLIENAFDLPDLDTLAAAAGLSRFHFHRVFKTMTGLTPKAYADSHRAQKARTELSRSATVTEAIYEAGFNSNGRFYAASSKMLGMTPAKFRSGGNGETIRFAVGECSLGAILVAATDQGICCILLGDDPEVLVRVLQDRFRRAELVGGDREFEQLVAKVVGFVEAPGNSCDLPMHIQGTAFQQRVRKALSDIPAGTTLSYTELAERIGAPKAVRAVASACAANAFSAHGPWSTLRCGAGDIPTRIWLVTQSSGVRWPSPAPDTGLLVGVH